jgi:RHS repeat-associated protein
MRRCFVLLVAVLVESGAPLPTRAAPVIPSQPAARVLAVPAPPAAIGPRALATPVVIPDTTLRVSESSTHGQGNGVSQNSYMSADGRYVVFQSDATTLVSSDTNGTADVFLHDHLSGATTRVSVSSSGTQGNGASLDPAISADGRYVTYVSAATNLVTGDTNAKDDIFVYDRGTAATARISVSSSGTQATNISADPVLSADGHYVAFQSSASNLVSGDTNNRKDIFVRDRTANTTTRISVSTAGAQATDASYDPAVSDDGRYIAFESVAPNLVSADTNLKSDIFLRDTQTSTTTRLSVSTSGTQGDGDSFEPAVAGNGSKVAFESASTNLVSGDTNAVTDIFVRDLAASTSTRVSVDGSGAQVNGASGESAISADGSHVAFDSLATNLVTGDTNAKKDVFVRDLGAGTTTRASVSVSGAQADKASANPAITRDNRTVAFQSEATNLVSGDTNVNWDVFVRQPADRADYSNLGRQPQHVFESWSLGGGDELGVNVANRNALIGHSLVNLPFRGGSLSIALAYNSQDAANVGLGAGWRLCVQRRLTLNPDGTVTVVNCDGARYTFTSPVTVGTVTTYTRPTRFFGTLVEDTSQGLEFTLTYPDQSRDKFDISGSDGWLARSEERHGNGVDLAYTPGTTNLSSITDPAGRQVIFTWDTAPDPDRLTSLTDWAYIDGNGVVQTTNSGSRRSYRFFYDSAGRLAGWSDPLNTTGSCPTGGSHLTCLTYTDGIVTAIGKTQTLTTFSGGTLGTTARAISTELTYVSGRVATVTDAEQQAQPSPARTTFTVDSATQISVARPTTTTRYTLAGAFDPFGRATSVFRVLDGQTSVERRTAWDTTFLILPASVTDNAGAVLNAPARTVSYSYAAGSLGLVEKLVEPLTASTNRWTEFTYNANNDATQRIVSQDGSTSLRTITRYCFDASCTLTGAGLDLLKQIDKYVSGGATDDDTNVAFEYQYDSYGQRTRTTRHNRDAAGGVLDDRVDAATFDNNGSLSAGIVNYVDGQVTGGYDVDADPVTLARTDLTSARTYDTAGNQVSSADPRRAIAAALGQNLGADDFVTRWTFDALNQSLTEKTPTTPGLLGTQRTMTSVYDELSDLRSATDVGSLVTASEFDRGARRLRTFEQPSGSSASVTSQTTYDPDGKQLTAKDRKQVADSSLGSTTFGYDLLGRQTSVTEAAGTSTAAVTETGYDGLDRRSSLEVGVGDPASLRTTYAYDLGGRATTTDDGFTCTTEALDYRDLKTSTASGLVGGTCADGANKRIVTHTSDGLARLTRSEVTYGSGTGDRTVDDVYDAVGNRRSAAVKTGGVTTTTTFGVSRLDQITSEQRADGSTAKANYDAAGNRTDRCYWTPGVTVGNCYPVGTSPWSNPPTQVTTTSFDALNQRVSLADAASGSLTTYDPDHLYLIKALYRATANGREQQALYSYDARHRPSGITFQTCSVNSSHACTDTPVANGSDSYTYDDNDSRTQVVESNAATSSDRRYCYDARNQLIYRNTGAACSSSANDESFTYDDADNRLTATASGTTTNFAYDAAGRLCDMEVGGGASCTGGNVSTDTAGRISSWNSWTFAYDAEGRLTSACKSSTCASGFDKVEFTYDGEGHRTKIVATAAGGAVTTTDFRYQRDAVVEEKVNGTVVRQFVTDESGAISKLIVPSGQADAGTYIVNWNGHGDALNLLRVNADGTTTLANSFTYSTWGAPTTSTHNGIADLGFRYLYVGQGDVQWDNAFGLGLMYMHARHYAPILGRNLEPDPIAADRNPYAYALNSAITNTDSSGLATGYRWGTCGWMRMHLNAAGSRGWASLWGEAGCYSGFFLSATWTISWWNFSRGVGGSISGSNPWILSYRWTSPVYYRFTGSGRVGASVSTFVGSIIFGRYSQCVGLAPYAETWIF